MKHTNAIALVEKLLLAGKVEQATRLLERVKVDFGSTGDGPELFHRWLALAPNDELLFEVRALALCEADQPEDAARDLVRGLLVARSREASTELTAVLARVGQGLDLQPWAKKALEAVSARHGRDAEREKALLLEAIRLAPTEPTLFVALASNQRGTSSDVELFALRNAVRLFPLWVEGKVELARALRGAGDVAGARRIVKTLLDHQPDCFLALAERVALENAGSSGPPESRRTKKRAA